MAENKRFLREAALRNALYDSTGGRCAFCGTFLESGWHADHSVPWKVAKRTNIFEMQPLCPSCNTKKGAKLMIENIWEAVDGRALRPGQRNAIDVIFSSIREGAKYIAIVLPPGYGKSDVIRVSSVMLMLQKMVCRTLILEPAENLRSQIVDETKMSDSVDRYNLPNVLGKALRTFEAKTAPEKPWPPGRNRDAAFVSMTMQMANRDSNRQFLEQWVAAEKRANNAPVLVFVDEAHTGSDQNEWGSTTRALVEAGAIAVLLTGTPYRSDGRPIEGFRTELEETKPVRLSRLRQDGEQRLVDIYEGQRSILRLEADYEHTLRESWDIDSPPALCKLTRLAYDFDLDSQDLITGDTLPDTALSRLTPVRASGRFGEFLRQDAVVTYLCEAFLRELHLRQQDAPSAAGIIFVGNNDNSLLDPLEREHALKVQSTLSRLSPSVKVMVATSDDSSEGLQALKRFQQGEGDVVVVKQMGGVGYDVPRLKVCLDLSVVRQAAPFVQRVMRIARVWRSGEGKDDVQMTAVYIMPDDMKGQALWQKLISDEHGDTNLTNVEYVETLVAKEGQGRFEHYEIADIRPSDTYSDSDFKEASADSLTKVEKVFSALPLLQRIATHPDVAGALPELQKIFLEDPTPTAITIETPPTAPPTNGERAVVVDGNKEQKAAQDKINTAAGKVAEKRLGRRYTPGDKDYGPMLKNVMYQHKQTIGIAHKKPVEYTAREADTLLASLEKELGNG